MNELRKNAQLLVSRKCGKENHFDKVCKQISKSTSTKFKKKVQSIDVEAESDSSGNYVYNIRGVSAEMPRVNILLGKQKYEIKFGIDIGSDCNILSKANFEQLNPRPILSTSTAKMYTYGQKYPIPAARKFDAIFQFRKATTVDTVYVVDVQGEPLLCKRVAERLGIISFMRNFTAKSSDMKTQIAKIFPKLFQSIGCY